MKNKFNIQLIISLIIIIFMQILIVVNAWKSRECPIDSQDNRETYLCIRPCDYDDYFKNNKNDNNIVDKLSYKRDGKNAVDDFFVVFFPPKQNDQYERSRFKCPTGFRQTKENDQQCFCERPYTPYELEMQRREKCDQSFERCRMYGSKPYDCNHIIDTCPSNFIREYCLAGKVFKMRFARVVYEFCHLYLRLPNNNDGRQHYIEPHIEHQKF